MCEHKRTCKDCNWHGDLVDMLIAPNPFRDDDTICVCPQCRAVTSTARIACDEPGCWDIARYGTPTEGGYRWTCSDHKPIGDDDV